MFFCILDYLSELLTVTAEDVAETAVVIGTAEAAEQRR